VPEDDGSSEGSATLRLFPGLCLFLGFATGGPPEQSHGSDECDFPEWQAAHPRAVCEESMQQRYRLVSPGLTRVDPYDRESPYDHLIRLVMVGDPGVGKSSFINRCVDDTFTDERYATIGVDFKFMLARVKGLVVKLQLWEPCGPERFRTISESYFHGADGVVLLYDPADPDTLERAEREGERIRIIIRRKPEKLCLMLCAGKCDLTPSPRVTLEMGHAAAERLGVPLISLSNKTGENVLRALGISVRECLAEKEELLRQTPAGQPPASHRAPLRAVVSTFSQVCRGFRGLFSS